MKVRDILGAGLERRFRGPRKPRSKQIGLHQKLKSITDDVTPVEEAKGGARIQHIEDLILGLDGDKGVAGGKKAIAALHQIETAPSSISIKWDGSPAVIFGRNENGEFVLTDKSGFGAKGYNGRVTSGEDLEQMFLNRAKGEIEDSRRAFASTMKDAWDKVESVIPADFRGYLHGDLLWFTTPQAKDGRLIFKPNVTTYSVDIKSDIGKKIVNSDVGIVVHQAIDLEGNKNSVDMSQLTGGNTFIMPPVYVTKSPGVDLPEVDRLESYLKANAKSIDDLLAVPPEQKMADFDNILYTYINNSVKAGNLDKLGKNFSEWVDSSKLSGPKKERVVAWVQQNSNGFEAIFQFINGVMATKNKIIKTLDSQSADIEASTNGEKGGEGYVIGKDVKLVNRAGFTAANMNAER